MSKTISINAGSSSLKWQLYQMPEETVLAKGLIERIGLKDSISTVKFDDRSEKQVLDIHDHTQAVKILLDDLIRFDIIKSYDEITGILVLLGVAYYRKSGKIKVFSALSHLPFGKGMIQAYLTAYYAREWGNMIGQGLELSQIFSMMQEQKSQLFQEIGVDLALSLDRGQSFSETVGHYPFFKKELPLMIEYGEVKSKLGSELEIYAEKTWEDFFRRVHKAMNVIQPLVFVFVALVIVLLYAAMLLPIYQNMEVHL